MSEVLNFDLTFGTGKAERALGSLNNKVAKFSDTTEKSAGDAGILNNAVAKVKTGFGGLVSRSFEFAKNMLAFSAISGIFSKMGEMMPFLGQGMRVIGDTLARNLIWPLTQELLPVLIKVIEWVRDNRVNFVKLGQVIANVFRIFMSVAKSVLKLVRSMFDSFFQAVGDKTGLTFDKVVRGLNFILLKVSFLINFILITIEPLIKAIGFLFGLIWKNAVSPFLDGFMKGFSRIGFVIQDAVSLLTDMARTIAVLFGPGTGELFRALGRIIGESLITTFRQALALVRVVWGFIKSFVKGFVKGFKSVMGKKGTGGFLKALKAISKLMELLFFDLFIPGLKMVTPLFEVLGTVIGTVLGGAVRLLIDLVDKLIDGFKWLANAIRSPARAWERLKSSFRRGFAGLQRDLQRTGRGFRSFFGEQPGAPMQRRRLIQDLENRINRFFQQRERVLQPAPAPSGSAPDINAPATPVRTQRSSSVIINDNRQITVNNREELATVLDSPAGPTNLVDNIQRQRAARA